VPDVDTRTHRQRNGTPHDLRFHGLGMAEVCASMKLSKEQSDELFRERGIWITERTGVKNGNTAGDLSRATRCGAKTRRGTSCQCPAMPTGRYRLHGGLSTGPKTAAGIERIRQAVTKHGQCSKRARAEREHYRYCSIGGRCWQQYPATTTNLASRREMRHMARRKAPRSN